MIGERPEWEKIGEAGKPAPIVAVADYATASRIMGELIEARYGSGPDVADSLDIRIFDVPHLGSARVGKAMVAAPLGKFPTPENVLAVYWGELPEAAR